MKALTLWRPWPWSIIHGPKRIENRPWKPPASIIGKRLALHAGKTYDAAGESFIRARLDDYGLAAPPQAELEQQGIIGIVTVTGFSTDAESLALEEGFGFGDMHQPAWFFGPFAWLLEVNAALPSPVPCKGMQGLWDLPPDVERAVLQVLR